MEVEMIPVSKGQGKENTGEDIGGGTGEGTKGDAKTGDSNHAGVWILISIVSALSMAVIMISVYIQHQKIRK